MKIEIFTFPGYTPKIRAAPAEREWMDNTREKYAYRCLPLNIANSFGWEILCDEGFLATWMGGDELEDITIQHDTKSLEQAGSHFGHGILTFHVFCLIKTEPGISLMAQGPINNPKDGIAPLTGVIETDWSPYSFTMNWKFTRTGTIRFHKGEPFCHIFPVSCNDLESVVPEIKPIADNPELKKEYYMWEASRGNFIKELRAAGSTKAKEEKWQKSYFRGQMPSGCPVSAENKHRTKLKLKEPIEKYNKNSS